MAVVVSVVVIAPANAVRVRLVLGSKIGDVIEMLPVVCKSEREPGVPLMGK